MEDPRVLITGAGGMLGNAIIPYFCDKWGQVVATDKDANDGRMRQLDVRDASALNAVWQEIQPELVLHLAAETNLEFCEENHGIAKATNDEAARTVAQLCESTDATLVYISTAGVFDGTKEGFYTEEDEPNPIMVYGHTKLAGEVHTRSLCSRHYVIRAGWMVGGGPAKDHKFVSQMLDQIMQGRKTLHAVNDKFGTPTYTHDFAQNLFRLLATREYGTYHMVCEGHGSRFDVANEIVRICGIPDIEVLPVDSSFFQEKYYAPRPRSEMMHNAHLESLGINLMRPWKDALADYVSREYSSLTVRSKE